MDIASSSDDKMTMVRLGATALLVSAAVAEPALDLRDVTAAAAAVLSRPGGGAALDPTGWPQHFVAEYTLMRTSAVQNTTYTGTVWASVPSRQMRFSGKQTTVFLDGSTHTGIFTYLESGVTGLKTLIAPEPNPLDPSAPSLLCRSSPIPEENSAGAADYTFVDNTLIGERVVGVYFDKRVPQPAMSSVFVDPFAIQPAAMITRDATRVNTTTAVYENMRPGA